jgi:hypothetical protein
MITLFGSGFAGFGWAKSPATAEGLARVSMAIFSTLCQIASCDRVGIAPAPSEASADSVPARCPPDVSYFCLHLEARRRRR